MSVVAHPQPRDGSRVDPPLAPSAVHDVCAVRVALRVKNEPLPADEPPFLTLHHEEHAVSFAHARDTRKTFTFDHVFSPNSTQSDVYAVVGVSAVRDVMDGKNATVMAYGQTGAGKSYTMLGNAKALGTDADGIIPRALVGLFTAIAATETTHTYSVEISILEIYGKKVVDLLSDDTREIKIQDTERLKAALEHVNVCDEVQAIAVVRRGFQRRCTSSTKMNERSSRSHAVCTVTVTRKLETDQSPDVEFIASDLTFVDLAGSERATKTMPNEQQRKEAAEINQSLLAITTVIQAIAEKAIFVAYRRSILTRLLQNALGGDSSTVFIACVSPRNSQSDETKVTLDHATHAKKIKNTIKSRTRTVQSDSEPTGRDLVVCCEHCTHNEPSEPYSSRLTAARQSLVYAHEQIERLDRLLFDERAKHDKVSRDKNDELAHDSRVECEAQKTKQESDAASREDLLSVEKGKVEELTQALLAESANYKTAMDSLVEIERLLAVERKLSSKLEDSLRLHKSEIEGLYDKQKDLIDRLEARGIEFSKLERENKRLMNDLNLEKSKVADLTCETALQHSVHAVEVESLKEEAVAQDHRAHQLLKTMCELQQNLDHYQKEKDRLLTAQILQTSETYPTKEHAHDLANALLESVIAFYANGGVERDFDLLDPRSQRVLRSLIAARLPNQ